MNQIFVGKSIAYSAKVGGSTIAGMNEIDLLDTGALAFFTEDGVLITNANKATALVDKEKILVAVGNQLTGSAAKAFISVPIPRGQGKVRYEKVAYVAPVKLTKFVGSDGTIGALNMPTFAVGNIAAIKITDTTLGLRSMGAIDKQEIFRYEYEAIPGDTNNTMITKLIAKINADSDCPVNATVVGSQAGINITADNYGTTFTIGLDEALIGATVEQPEGTIGSSVAMVAGTGTSDQVLALEDTFSAERGNTNRLWLAGSYYSNPSLVTSGATYNQYTIHWSGERSSSTGPQFTYKFVCIIAAPAAGTQETILEAILLQIFGPAQAVESGV